MNSDAMEDLESKVAATMSLNSEEEKAECPICLCVRPLLKTDEVYKPCCGQSICMGCTIEEQRVRVRDIGLIVEGVTPEEVQFDLILSLPWNKCPYCCAEDYDTDEEKLRRLRIRINKFNDSTALNILGSCYHHGKFGLPININEAEKLYQRAYDLEYSSAAFNLYHLYRDNYPEQKQKAMEFLQRGSNLGDMRCMSELVDMADASDNYEEMVRLMTKLARLGDNTAMKNCIIIYESIFYRRKNIMSKDELTTTLQENQAANRELVNDEREFAARLLQLQTQNIE